MNTELDLCRAYAYLMAHADIEADTRCGYVVGSENDPYVCYFGRNDVSEFVDRFLNEWDSVHSKMSADLQTTYYRGVSRLMAQVPTSPVTFVMYGLVPRHGDDPQRFMALDVVSFQRQLAKAAYLLVFG